MQTDQKQNNYFAYHINLDTLVSDTFLVPSSSNAKGWRTYRIPIRDTSIWDGHFAAGAAPILRWYDVNSIRVWLESPDGDPDTLTVDIANWYLVSSNWQDSVRTAITSPPITENSGSKFYVATVSEEENTNFRPPPGVEAYHDKATNTTEPQRAMTLVYDSLYPNDTCMAVKQLLSIDRYTGYRRLKMFVHGPDSADSQKIRFILRVGLDANNFYEYRTLLKPGWNEGNYVDMDFNALTGFKDELLRNRDSTRKVLSDSLGPDYHYYIHGSPNINQVKYLAVGLINLDTTLVAGRPRQISGEVWVDELRVSDVRADVGTAARFDVSGRLADLINYGVNYESKDPYFRGLSAATRGGSEINLGSGSSSKTYGWSLSMGLHKFLPMSWNVQLPVSFSFSKSEQLPLLGTNSDIILPAKARQLEKTTSERKSFNISESFARKSRNPLFSVLLNRQRSSFSYSRSLLVSPVQPYHFSEQYTVHGEYDMGYDRLKPLPIFFWTKPFPYLKKLQSARLGYYPNMWRWSGNFMRSLTVTRDNKDNTSSSFLRSLDYNMNLQYKMFQNIALDYTMNSRRDLSDTSTVRWKLSNLRLGEELGYNQSFRTGWSPVLFSFVSSSFGYSSTYSDNYNRQNKTRTGDVSVTWSVSGQFNHQALLGGRASSTGRISMPQPVSARDKVKKPSVPFYEHPRKLIRKVTSWINPVSYRYQTSYNSSVPGMAVRPGQMYRLGISRSPDVRIGGQNLSQPHSGEGKQYEFSSGFSFLGGLVLDVKLRRDITRDLIRAGDRNERISGSWPDLNIRIQAFKTFPLIKKQLNKFIQVFTPRTSYTRQTNEERNLTRGFTNSRSTSIAQSPLLALNFRAFKALSLSGSYNRTSTEARSFAKDGALHAISRTRNRSLAITTQYSFSAPTGIGLPLLGKVKFRSQMQISTDIRFNSTYSETEQANGQKNSARNATDFAVSPNIAYQFSPQIKGGLMARWQDSRDLSSKSHTRELRMWAEIRF
ncbi:MAG: cell surface protein SprA [candidate division Zixibacteria bacterium]|nr:cell surface protein SprA [candidate division Zixibacteria bacterium]